MAFFTVSTTFHIFTWVTACLLFFVLLFKNEHPRPLQLTLHSFYALIIISGTLLVLEAMNYGYFLQYATKFFVGALLIIAMELCLHKKRTQQSTRTLLLIMTALFLVIAWLGFTLPMGYAF